MAKPPSSNGSANIDKQGHTAVKEFGSDPNFKGTYGQDKPRDLNVGKG
jgi:hypothetical protein